MTRRRVEVPASRLRSCALGLVIVLFVALVMGAVLVLDQRVDWVSLIIYGGGGVFVLVRGLVLSRRPALVLDDDGIRGHDGGLLVSWNDVSAVWIGDTSPAWWPESVRSVSVRTWALASLAFARRTGFPPEPRLTLAVPTAVPAPELIELAREFTTATIHTGNGHDLRRLIEGWKAPPT